MDIVQPDKEYSNQDLYVVQMHMDMTWGRCREKFVKKELKELAEAEARNKLWWEAFQERVRKDQVQALDEEEEDMKAVLADVQGRIRELEAEDIQVWRRELEEEEEAIKAKLEEIRESRREVEWAPVDGEESGLTEEHRKTCREMEARDVRVAVARIKEISEQIQEDRRELREKLREARFYQVKCNVMSCSIR